VGIGSDGRDVARLAEQGDTRARAIFEEAGRALGIGMATLVNLTGMPFYVFSGAPMAAWELFMPVVIAELSRRSFVFRAIRPTIVRGALGEDATAIGAAYLALEESYS
jgi:glucokinase